MRTHDDTQRGSVTLWAVIAVAGLLMVVGLVVDGGGQLRATQQADQVAREAARSAAQAISGDPILGRPGLIDNTRGRQAGFAYLTAAGVPGDVTIGGGQVRVSTYVSYTPVLLSAFGISTITVTGEATATTQRVYQGAER